MPSDSVAGSCGFQAEGDECSVDADCTAKPFGRCNEVGGFMATNCACEYGCERDADCGEGRACYCAGMSSRCVTAYCRSQSDCGEGYLCAMLDDDVLACHRPDDACRTDRDCADGICPACEYDPARTAWECVPDGGQCDTGGG